MTPMPTSPPLRGWKEPDCHTCTENFGPPGKCISCDIGWAGQNCSECASNFEPPGECSRCSTGWAGDNCDTCAPTFGPPGSCDTCRTGWTGLACDVCERFGFSTENDCTECIQDGALIGEWTWLPSNHQGLIIYLTFEGPACTNVVPGMY